jgi:hypothetical protein
MLSLYELACLVERAQTVCELRKLSPKDVVVVVKHDNASDSTAVPITNFLITSDEKTATITFTPLL